MRFLQSERIRRFQEGKPQKGNGALSMRSFVTKKVRVLRTPGGAFSFSPCNFLMSNLSFPLIFKNQDHWQPGVNPEQNSRPERRSRILRNSAA